MKTSFIHRLSILLLVLTVTSVSRQSLSGETAAFVDSKSVVDIEAWFLTGDNDRDGTLFVTADVQDGYHIYSMSQPKPFIATEIRLAPSNQATVGEVIETSMEPSVRVHQTLGVELHEHEGRITWTAPLRFAPDVTPEAVSLTGQLRVLACTEGRCLAPSKIPFEASYHSEASPALAFAENRLDKTASAPGQSSIPEDQAAGVTFDLNRLELPAGHGASTSVWIILPIAFLAGLILNFMPCVLPVIGLKLMSFLQQADDSRRRAFTLNVWYSLGILSVMMVLARLAVFAGIGWGEQFSSSAFNIVLASAVFAFALSFLGVWEIPIPGFVGSMAAGSHADQEGYAGAFSKGVLTTLLATPCSGPFLGSALTWAVSQPAPLTYTAFAAIGPGMASPYLVIGAFPVLTAFLPKPGAWMQTFKQAMGFVLLGTVVYLLSFLSIPYVVPTLALILGLGVACWWIGRVLPTQPLSVRLRVWGSAAVIVTSTAWVAFGWLDDVMAARVQRAFERELADRQVLVSGPEIGRNTASHELPWQPFSRDLLGRLLAEGKPVFVDSTADWCLTCKANEAVAVNRPEVRQLVDELGIVTLRADKTEANPEVDEMLRLLGNRAGSIPFYAVFPAHDPGKPILLDGIFTSPERITSALKKARS